MAATGKFSVGKKEMDAPDLWVDTCGTGKPEFCFFSPISILVLKCNELKPSASIISNSHY